MLYTKTCSIKGDLLSGTFIIMNDSQAAVDFYA